MPAECAAAHPLVRTPQRNLRMLEREYCRAHDRVPQVVDWTRGAHLRDRTKTGFGIQIARGGIFRSPSNAPRPGSGRGRIAVGTSVRQAPVPRAALPLLARKFRTDDRAPPRFS
jgi:hypothetical protein